jgi:GT2 family glycosyltransferase
MSKPKVGVVILNWNRLDLTKTCLHSIAKQTYRPDLIIVVDNGSTDGSLEWLHSNKNIYLISNNKNLGFARAINQGFSSALKQKCSYVVSLNNDTELDKNWLGKMVNYMETTPGVGFAQGASLQQGNKNIYDSTGIYLEKGFIPNQRALGQADARLDIPAIGPNAAGAIYLAKLLEAVAYKGEYFDSKFFAYVEDVDFDLRCTMRGYKFGFVTEAKLYHIGSATGNKIAKKKMYWGARNLVWLVYKNAPFGVFVNTFGLILRSHLANLQFLWREQRENFLPYLRGLMTGIFLSPQFLLKRRNNLATRSITDKELMDLLIPSRPPLSSPFRHIRNLLK